MISPKRPGSSMRKLFASGAGLTRTAAAWATLGEALERYAGSVYFEADLIEAPFAEVESHALDPRDLISFSDVQYRTPGFPFVRFDPAEIRRWVGAWDLTNQREILVPAQCAILGYVEKFHAERLDNTYSTGLAAARSYQRAAASAIREVIERDAFMCHWYTRTSPRRIPLEDLAKSLRPEARSLLRCPGVTLNVLNITTDLAVPCILAMIERHAQPGIAVGASCHLDVRQAIEKAVIEAFHCLCWLLDLDRSGEGPCDLSEVANFEDHTRYYLDPARHKNLEFLRVGQLEHLSLEHANVTLNEEEEFQTLLQFTRDHGTRVILVDLTPEDVRQLGFVVVRAILPGLQPLSCGPGREHLDTRRLRAFCARDESSVFESVNLDLHPFP